MHLLDINILIASADEAHPHHQKVVNWMSTHMVEWATCPLTENGFLRIFGHANYPGGGPGSPEKASIALKGMIAALPGHHFFPDRVSLLDSRYSLAGLNSRALTDIYLLALAVDNGAYLATLDQLINPSNVIGGENACIVIA
ncbi:MAG: VapC toxin family PIN domain ribonuclease [Verrucomicrobiota bacterium]